MKNQIIIHAAGKQTRIALLENSELTQLFIESPENQRTVGDIYLAEVRKVMGGIRAAFIDMNTPKDAFLHFSDLGEHLDDYLIMLNGQGAVTKESLAKVQEYRNKKDDAQNSKNITSAEEQNLLGNLLKAGQKVLVQIVKEPIGSKGPRVSTNISIAGRFLVLIPMGDYVAVSKRIKSYKERRVLRQTVADILPEGFGVIVRTVAEGQDPKMIHDDLMDVLDKWNNIVKNLDSAKPPALLHRDLEMTESLVRDLFAKDFERILVDDPKMFKSLKSYVSRIAPNMLPNITLYKGSDHIFDHMKIMQDVESVFSPRVKMPSGGYLIFEQTEAMYVVDVNSGRYAAKKAQEDNSLKTNLEAAREIAKQLRLRDIGGIIVVDFIDLRDDVNRKKVYDELKKEFRKDRAKTNVLPMSDFGLVQITRQRIRPSVVKSVSRVCPMCGGGGSIVSQNTILSDIEGWLSKFRRTTTYRSVDLHINPYMKGMLTKGWISQHFKWMLKFRLRIGLIEDVSLSMNDYKFTPSGSDVDITETILMDQSIEAAIQANEQRIAELESELKRDSSTLDIYRKEKTTSSRGDGDRDRDTSAGRNSAGDDRRREPSGNSSRNDRGDRPERAEKRETEARPAPKAPEARTPRTNEAVRDKKSDVQPPASEKTVKDNTKETRNSDNRRNQNISKYYKRTDEESAAEENDSTQAQPPQASSAPTAVAEVIEKSKPIKSAPDTVKNSAETKAPAKSAKKSASESPDEIPEDLSHLRSAWEVAREYKIKRERELRGESSAEEAPTKSNADAVEQSATVEVAEKVSQVSRTESEVSTQQATVTAETASTEADTSTDKEPTAVAAAGSIVQALVTSSKLRDDATSSDPVEAPPVAAESKPAKPVRLPKRPNTKKAPKVVKKAPTKKAIPTTDAASAAVAGNLPTDSAVVKETTEAPQADSDSTPSENKEN
jgi:ribonuclease G